MEGLGVLTTIPDDLRSYIRKDDEQRINRKMIGHAARYSGQKSIQIIMPNQSSATESTLKVTAVYTLAVPLSDSPVL